MNNDSRIHQLSDAVKHMIAAGEVVEGAFSVIKELVENSIDAGATSIDIEAEDSGFRRITVKDNGCGIYREDIPLAIKEHATSKIKDIGDISEIMSYGFRGEALSSIAAVSNLVILSRRADEKIGGRLEVKNGVVSISDYAGASGTTIIVENIFYNTPARKKFLKSISAEARAIRETVTKIAIARNGVSFNLIINGKKVFSIPSVSSTEERISQLFGKEELDGLVCEKLNDISVSIEGYLSRPYFMKATRASQFLFVNRRPVEMKSFGFLLSRAYESAAPHGKYPAAIIFIEIQPDLVDVNIHPAKREIKFFDQRYIEGMIVGLVRKTLEKREQKIDFSAIEAVKENSHVESSGYYVEKAVESNETIKVREIQNELSYRSNADKPGSFNNEPESLNDSSLQLIGSVFGTYLLVQKEEDLKIIDFHAAHERFNYDIIINSKNVIEQQELVFPEVIEFSKNDFINAIEILDMLNSRGFDCEPFSEDSIIVRAVPSMIRDSSIKNFFKELIETLGGKLDQREEIIASRMACHASRRANDMLSRTEMMHIAEEALSGKHSLVCPHGRPYIYSVNRDEFEKLFRR